MDYYVYKLIDSRNGELFYVGKGCRDRYKHHVRSVLRETPEEFGNKHLYYKIQNILGEEGKSGIDYEIVSRYEDEQKAYEAEKQLINKIGVDNLCNIGLGGEGLSNTEEVRKKISSSVLEWRNSMSEREEKKFRKKISEGQAKFWNSEKSNGERKRRSNLCESLWQEGKLSKENAYTEKFVEASKKHKKEIKGKSYEEIYGEEKAEEIKSKMSESKRGKNNPMYGKELDKQTKEKISESNSGSKNPNSKTYIVDCNGKTERFETRKEVKEAIKKYNEKNNLGWGEKIVYGKLFENGVSKSWKLLDKKRG